MESAERNSEAIFHEMTAVLEITRGVRGTVGALRQWFWQNIVANDVIPRSLPFEVESLFSSLHQEVEAIERASPAAVDRYREVPFRLASMAECFHGSSITCSRRRAFRSPRLKAWVCRMLTIMRPLSFFVIRMVSESATSILLKNLDRQEGVFSGSAFRQKSLVWETFDPSRYRSSKSVCLTCLPVFATRNRSQRRKSLFDAGSVAPKSYSLANWNSSIKDFDFGSV